QGRKEGSAWGSSNRTGDGRTHSWSAGSRAARAGEHVTDELGFCARHDWIGSTRWSARPGSAVKTSLHEGPRTGEPKRIHSTRELRTARRGREDAREPGSRGVRRFVLARSSAALAAADGVQ